MRTPFVFAGALFSFTCCSALAVAQSTGSSRPSAHSQQGSSTSPPPEADSAAKPAEKKRPKKVWTNEEVGNLKSTVSVVGDPAAVPADAPGKSKARGPTELERYRRQLAPLRTQLEDVERQIREVKSLGSQGGAYNNTSLDKLDERRRSIQAKIDAIEDDARRHGIAPGDLR